MGTGETPPVSSTIARFPTSSARAPTPTMSSTGLPTRGLSSRGSNRCIGRGGIIIRIHMGTGKLD